METIRMFPADASGAIAIEHWLFAAAISLAFIAAVNRIGTKLHPGFASLNPSLK